MMENVDDYDEANHDFTEDESLQEDLKHADSELLADRETTADAAPEEYGEVRKRCLHL